MRGMLTLFTAIVTLAGASTAAAQTSMATSDARWSAWLGCWAPSVRSGEADTRVCIVPSDDGRGVRMLTFAGDREVLAETLVADGSRQTMTEKECAGERRSHWAARGPRLFSASTLTCAGQPPLNTTSVAALVAADRWLDVQVTRTGGRDQVRTRRYWRTSGTPPAPIADVIGRLPSTRPVVPAVTADDVIEASNEVPSIGVEAWLAESGVRIGIDRRALVRLSDANVGPNVIDLLVAMAFPKKFEVRRAESSGGGLFGGSMLDGYVPGDWGFLADTYGLGFGFLGMPYYLGYSGYYPGPIYYIPPAVGGGEPTEHGQVVNGQGYTRVRPRETPGTAMSSPRGGQSTGGDSGGSSSGGSTASSGSSGGASPAGYSGGGGTSTGLTAVPR